MSDTIRQESGSTGSEYSPGKMSDLPKLSSDCLLKVANETMEQPKVISVLGKLDRGFCFHLGNDIITQAMQEEIKNCRNSDEALGIIRTSLKNSLVPDKLDRVIEVLREKSTMHAKEIEQCYHAQIRKHSATKQQCCKV